jgi:hypothetical protein
VFFLALQIRGSAMGSPIQIALDTGVAQLLDALGRFCDAEGLATSDLHSINFLEDEVEVVIVRADGSRRHNFYPMAAFGGAPIRRSGLPVVVPQKLPPSGGDTKV